MSEIASGFGMKAVNWILIETKEPTIEIALDSPLFGWRSNLACSFPCRELLFPHPGLKLVLPQSFLTDFVAMTPISIPTETKSNKNRL